MKHSGSRISRRNVLGAGAALAGASAFGLNGPASAQSKGKIVVGTWGGDYARLLNKNIEAPFLIPQGWEVVQDQAGQSERKSKVFAERRLPKGTVDLHGFSAADMFQMHDSGLVEEISYGRLKNAPNLLPSMKYKFGVGHIYSAKVGVHNPKIVAEYRRAFEEVSQVALPASEVPKYLTAVIADRFSSDG